MTPFQEEVERGEIDDLFEAAALGELEDTGDGHTKIKPIRMDPEVFELRRKTGHTLLRFYHAEPAADPTLLLRLHSHIKVDNVEQQAAIRFAVARYSLWLRGLSTSRHAE